MTVTTHAAGNPRYLKLLANTALSADERPEDDAIVIWSRLDRDWGNLEGNKDDPSALARISITGMALLRALTGTPVPHLAAQAAQIHVDKNAGYAGIGNPDPWANFRLATRFNISAYDGVLVRMSDKYIRLRNLRANPANDRIGESIVDTLVDLVAYALIAICLWEESRS